MGGGQGEHGEALRQVFLHPRGEFGRAFDVVGDDFSESLFGRGATGAFKDAADGARDFGALIQARNVSLGVLLEVELAALPRNGAKDGLARGGHAGVIIADDERDAAQAALNEALEEGAPMHLRFTEGDAHAEDGALAFGRDAQGDEDGAVAELAVVADFFVAGIEHQIGTGCQRPVAPFLEFGVQEFGAVADLGGTDGGAAEFLDDGGDFAGGDALDVHFGQGKFESLLGTDAFFQGAGIEVGVAPDLRDAEGDGADAAGEGLGFVAVGVTLACVGAFVGLGLEDLMAFDAHGFVDEDADPFGEAVVALLSQKLQDVVQEFRIGVVGHVVCLLDVLEHPNRKPMWPALDQFFARSVFTPPGFGCARLATLAFAPPHPGGVKTEERKTNYRRSFTPTIIRWRMFEPASGRSRIWYQKYTTSSEARRSQTRQRMMCGKPSRTGSA
jgi:hypothetical protein